MRSIDTFDITTSAGGIRWCNTPVHIPPLFLRPVGTRYPAVGLLARDDEGQCRPSSSLYSLPVLSWIFSPLGGFLFG